MLSVKFPIFPLGVSGVALALLSPVQAQDVANPALAVSEVELLRQQIAAMQSQIELQKQQVSELQKRLDKVETAKSEAAKTEAKSVEVTVNSNSKLPVTVGGLLQVHYLSYPNDDRGGSGPKSTFRLRRGQFRVTLPRITDKVSGLLVVDTAKTRPYGRESNGATVGNERNAILQDLVVSYALKKTDRELQQIDVGQFKLPLGFEGDLISSRELQTVERAQAFSATLGNSNVRLGFDQRDSGVRYRGRIGEWSYDLGAFNGMGERQNTLDFDGNKALAARLIYRPIKVDGLALGVSHGRGAIGPVNENGSLTQVDRTLSNAFLVYRRDKITAQAEYFDIDLEGRNGFDLKAKSYYANLGYKLTPQWELVGRYDAFNADRRAGGQTTRETTLGVNYYINRNWAKIQANLVKVGRPESGTPAASQDSLELRTNFQLAF